MSADAVTLVRRAYDAYHRGKITAVFDLLDSDVEIHQTGQLPWGGSYRGRDQARHFFRRLAEHTDTRLEPVTFVPAGESVAVIGRLRGRARGSGNPIDLDIVHVWTVRSGKIVRFDAYIDTPAMLQALAD